MAGRISAIATAGAAAMASARQALLRPLLGGLSAGPASFAAPVFSPIGAAFCRAPSGTKLRANVNMTSQMRLSTSVGLPLSARAYSGGAGGQNEDPNAARISLNEALNRLVDAAVEKVEQDNMAEAITILQDGLALFAPRFPGYPEIGELHGQLSLLLFAQGTYEEAVVHARPSLEITEKHFGRRSVLTAHRMLRLGAALFPLGKTSESLPLLREAYDLLSEQDASQAEAGFYMDLCVLATAREEAGVTAIEESLLHNLTRMKRGYGSGTMLLSLATAQHSRLAHNALERDFGMGEALLKQHLAVLTAVSASGEGGPESAVATYKLATLYYSNDRLPAAAARVQEASKLARQHLGQGENELDPLCRHRMGMVLAARGEPRTAVRLLEKSAEQYGEMGKQSAAAAMLAREAEIGLVMCKFFSLDPRAPGGADALNDVIEDLRKKIQDFGQAIGQSHMLVQGATRYYAQICKAAGRS